MDKSQFKKECKELAKKLGVTLSRGGVTDNMCIVIQKAECIVAVAGPEHSGLKDEWHAALTALKTIQGWIDAEAAEMRQWREEKWHASH